MRGDSDSRSAFYQHIAGYDRGGWLPPGEIRLRRPASALAEGVPSVDGARTLMLGDLILALAGLALAISFLLVGFVCDDDPTS